MAYITRHGEGLRGEETSEAEAFDYPTLIMP